MRVVLKLSEQSSRKLSSVVRGGEDVIVLFTYNQVHLIMDKTEFLRGLNLTVDNSIEMYLTVPSCLFKLVKGAGFLVIEVDGGRMKLGFARTEEGVKTDSYIWVSDGSITSLTKSMVVDYLHILNNGKNNLLQTESLNNLKGLINACVATDNGLMIRNGMAITDSSTSKIYRILESDDLQLGLSVSALKEIEKFKLDCEVLSIKNYIVFHRGDFMLAVRKCVIANITTIPKEYMIDATALAKFDIDLTHIVELISGDKVKKSDLQLDSNKCIIDINSSVTSVQLSGGVFNVYTPIEGYTNNSQIVIDQVEFNIEDLKPLGRMMGEKPASKRILIYPKIARFCLNGDNALVRCKINEIGNAKRAQ